jgi:N6-L-threonylcarbamoyladenine synthase
VLEKVLTSSKINLKDINYICVTTAPWLLPSLLTGTTTASTISTLLNIPIIPINHIEAHIFANFLDRNEDEIKFPLVCLTISGWHNDIYLMKDMWTMEKLGSSIDDAGGEAFDKAAKMMWLGYPGWPIISKLASEFSTLNSVPPKIQEWLFPRVWLKKREFNFSFSGLKTSIKTEIDKRIKEKWELTLEDKRELSFEIENAITEVLAWKLINAGKTNGLKTIMLAWWVSANTKLKNEIQKLADKENIKFVYPKKTIYSMDNAAMVAINGYYKVKYGKFENKIGVVKV